MRFFWLTVFILFLAAFSCTDKEAEEKISGHWNAFALIIDSTGQKHDLPGTIYFEFKYPEYTFQADTLLTGKYYIKNDYLFLLDKNGEQKRKLQILKMTPDTLIFNMVDSTGNRTIKFIQP